MKRIILILMFLIVLLLNNAFAITEEELKKDPAQVMAKADYSGSRVQFESLLNIIHNYFTDTPRWEIALKIGDMYTKAKETVVDISLYEFTAGFKDFIRDEGISTYADFEEALVLYTTSVELGY